MKFRSGMLGCLIVVLSLVGTIISGYALAITEEDVQATDYKFVTDVSGLFEHSDVPQYIPYDPATNYTGYRDANGDIMQGMNYSTTDRANNYRIPVEPDPVTGSWPQISVPGVDGVTLLNAPGTSSSMHARICTVHDLVEHSAGLNNEVIYINRDAAVHAPCGKFCTFDGHSTATNVDGGSAGSSPNAVVYPQTDVVQVYLGTRLVYTGTMENTYYTVSGNGPSIGDPPRPGTRLSTDWEWKAVPLVTYKFLDPAKGVSLQNGSAVTWSNGYDNGSMDILVHKAHTGNSDLDLQYSIEDHSFKINIHYASGDCRISVSDTVNGATTESTADVGHWPSFLLSVNFLGGTVCATPISQFTTFTNVTVYDHVIPVAEVGTTGPVNEVSISNSNDVSPSFSVYGTDVYLNTHDAVMVDPSLDIREYFTDLTNLRLNLYSFAVYGQTLNINGRVFDVHDGTITVTDNGTDRVLELQNIYITFMDGNTSVTWVNEGFTMNLGLTTTTTVSGTGIWYFTTGLYEAYSVVDHVYTWDGGVFVLDYNQSILILLGFLALGTLLAKASGRLKALDLIIIIGAGFVIMAALGGLT